MTAPSWLLKRACVTALCLAIPTIAAAGSPCTPASALSLAQVVAVGHFPHGVAIADLNGDGIPDLVVANSNWPVVSGQASVSVHLGIGVENYGPAVAYPVTGAPFHVVIADFDGDGYLDLVTADYNSSVISFFRGVGSAGVGSGSFASEITYPAGLNPSYVLARDFNGDGRPDLAVLNLTSGTLSILMGQPPSGPGQGLFSAPTEYVLGDGVSYPATATSGDFNGDGITDLAVALYGSSQIAILFGAGSGGVGNGTFQSPVYVPVGTNPWNVQAVDLNGDGILDLLESDFNGLGVLIGGGSGGLGNGTFAAPVHYGSLSYPQGMAIADFTRDGIPDVALGLVGSASVLIYGGNGDGTFTNPAQISAGSKPFALAAADLNGDGHPDLAVVNYGDNTIGLYADTCSATVTPQVVGQWTPQGQPVCLAAGDQDQTVACADGAGGAFITWRDTRSGTGVGIYATRIDGNGQPVSGWIPGGTPLCTAPNDRNSPEIVADGTGGVIVGWLDKRSDSLTIYLQHVLAGGAIAPGWPVNGLRVCTSATQFRFTMDADGSGGVIIAAYDPRGGSDADVYAFRVTGAATYAAGWDGSGRLVASVTYCCRFVEITAGPTIVGDGAGGGFIAARFYLPPGPDYDPGFDASSLYRVTDTASTLVMGAYNQPTSPRVGPDGGGGAFFILSNTAGVPTLYDVGGGGSNVWVAALQYNTPWWSRSTGSGGAMLVQGSPDGHSILGLRFTGSGTPVPNWSSRLIVSGSGSRSADGLVLDDAGGAYIAWTDGRFGQNDLYAIHLAADATLAPGWALNGNPVYDLPGARDPASVVPDGAGGAIAVWSDTRNGNKDVFAQRLVSDIPVPALASLVSAESFPGLVRLVWFAAGQARREFRVERQSASSGWEPLASVTADGTGRISFEDRQVAPGSRYGYRLGLPDAGSPAYFGEAWVQVPLAFTLALEVPRPNPASGAALLEFSLPQAGSARLEVLDVSGRRVWMSRGEYGAGIHSVRWTGAGGAAHAPAGVYFARLVTSWGVRAERFVML